ncbi:nucleotidyltransferase domain-containing protein [Corynebacterium amycolatum]|uniref:nucleotidyltransferase domain-containing protein n=1 Tax=Corynebacterium amycolatum TaxID=43765 RepID=UPI002119D88A|nr:nucleotidyltransferase domain-containing protein [Corynebacterium amycolatum]MCQ9125284.1 nucleotidyltransferase domain-containing protein [Corynebacterium amycolatum]
MVTPGIVRKHLIQNSVPYRIANELKTIPKSTKSVLMYGSRARGDATSQSDLDLLCLTTKPERTTKTENISVAAYTLQELKTASGTLYGFHLKRDAIIILDPDSTLENTINNFSTVNVDEVFSKCRYYAQIFSTLDTDFPHYAPGLYKEARYFLRSALYAKSIAENHPCFSVRELAYRYNTPALARLLSTSGDNPPTLGNIKYCIELMKGIIGDVHKHEYANIETLAVAIEGQDPNLESVIKLAMTNHTTDDNYVDIKAIFL